MEMSTPERLRVQLIRCGQKLGSGQGKRQTQGRILKILYHHGPMTQKTLQDKLDIQPGSMSEIAAKLEHKGLLCREKDPVDKRQILLTLTEAGRADVEQFHMERKSQHPHDFDALSQEEQQQLSQLLEKLLNSWSAAQESGCHKNEKAALPEKGERLT